MILLKASWVLMGNRKYLWVSRKPKEPCSRIRLLCAKCHSCTSNWASLPNFDPFGDEHSPGCLTWGLLSDGSLFQYFSFQYWTTNHPGKQTFAISFLFSCSYIFPFVKLASCALMISSKSAFIPFKLCFFLAFTLSSDFFVYSSFFLSFFLYPALFR